MRLFPFAGRLQAFHLQGLRGRLNVEQAVNVGMLARVGAGILGVLGVNLQTEFRRFRRDRTERVGQPAVDAQRARLAGFVLDLGHGRAGLVDQLDGCHSIHGRQQSKIAGKRGFDLDAGHLPEFRYSCLSIRKFSPDKGSSVKPSVTLELHRAAIRAAVRRCRSENPRVFGSVAKGLDCDGSDLDLLVDPLPGATLFDLGELQVELEELLGVRVDLLTPRDLSPRLREQIITQAQAV
ncbi:conserved hypothetical protein [Ricinus communis]|uniref:Polymerase nucleotidyl transferase domain-containing protein n=1 Tax=Ricinus communis TaxID=3988 RepID=B9TPS7_RICCO|nr:conserved hypothetical protein [Ricinus communis]